MFIFEELPYWLHSKDLQGEPSISRPYSVPSLIEWHSLSYLLGHFGTVLKCSLLFRTLRIKSTLQEFGYLVSRMAGVLSQLLRNHVTMATGRNALVSC